MIKLIKFLIWFWIVLGGIMLALGAYFLLSGYEKDGLTFLAFAGIGVVMVWLNKKRMKLYGERQEPPQKDKKKQP